MSPNQADEPKGPENVGVLVRQDTERPDGVALIAAERERQVSEEGWTAEHDDAHVDGELAVAAACYADRHLPPDKWPFEHLPLVPPDKWPFEDAAWKPRQLAYGFYDADDRLRELAKAGALIAAEIDRLLRVRDTERPEEESATVDLMGPLRRSLGMPEPPVRDTERPEER